MYHFRSHCNPSAHTASLQHTLHHFRSHCNPSAHTTPLQITLQHFSTCYTNSDHTATLHHTLHHFRSHCNTSQLLQHFTSHCDTSEARAPVPWPDIPLCHIILTLSQPVFAQIPGTWIGNDKHTFLSHWLPSTRVWTSWSESEDLPKQETDVELSLVIPNEHVWAKKLNMLVSTIWCIQRTIQL